MNKFVSLFIFSVIVCGVLTIHQLQKHENLPSSILNFEQEALADKTPSDLYNCSCGLLWGTGCKRDNWGVDCYTGETLSCADFNKDCS